MINYQRGERTYAEDSPIYGQAKQMGAPPIQTQVKAAPPKASDISASSKEGAKAIVAVQQPLPLKTASTVITQASTSQPLPQKYSASTMSQVRQIESLNLDLSGRTALPKLNFREMPPPPPKPVKSLLPKAPPEAQSPRVPPTPPSPSKVRKVSLEETRGRSPAPRNESAASAVQVDSQTRPTSADTKSSENSVVTKFLSGMKS